MSGGHFDYKCFEIGSFASQLKKDIENNNKKDNEYEYAPDFDDETLAVLERCYNLIKQASDLAYHVEWLYSGDIGEERFRKLVFETMLTEEEKIVDND